MEKEKSICFSLKRVNHIVERGIHTSLAAAGFDEITNMHGWILGFLYHAQRPVYQKDIESNFGIARSTVTNILQLMEKKGHLDTIAVIDSAHDTMEAGITDEERRICFEVLEKICKNVEKITGGE